MEFWTPINFQSRARGDTTGSRSRNRPTNFFEVLPHSHGLANCRVAFARLKMPRMESVGDRVRLHCSVEVTSDTTQNREFTVEAAYAQGNRTDTVVQNVMTEFNRQLLAEGEEDSSAFRVEQDDEDGVKKWRVVSRSQTKALFLTINGALAAMLGHRDIKKKIFYLNTNLPGAISAEVIVLSGSGEATPVVNLLRQPTFRLTCNLWEQNLLEFYDQVHEVIPLKPFVGEGSCVYEPKHLKFRDIKRNVPYSIHFQLVQEGGIELPYFPDESIAVTEGAEVTLLFAPIGSAAERRRFLRRYRLTEARQEQLDELESSAGFGY